MRLFAALALPDEARDRLAGLQGGLPEAKRVAWENFHVTLAFFGEVDPRGAEDLDAALARIEAERFDLRLTGAGAFGGDKPRLAYAGVEAAAPLLALQDKVVRAARAAGVSVEERRYVPHATLARFRGGRMDERLRRWLEGAAAFSCGPIPVEAFTLFQSRLGHTGPAYAALRDYALRAASSGA